MRHETGKKLTVSDPDLFDGLDNLPELEVSGQSDLTQAVRMWNDMAADNGLSKVQRVTEIRRRKLRRRLAECGGLAGWQFALAKVADSAFLKGDNRRGWRCNFDFLLQESSFTRLMEGDYDSVPGHQSARDELDGAFARMRMRFTEGTP